MSPPLPVPPLRLVAQNCLAEVVSAAVIRCTSHQDSTARKSRDGKKTKKKKNKGRRTQSEPPSLFLVDKELSRIKAYLRNARPKQSKQELFQEILRVFTKMLTLPIIPEKRVSYENQFLDRIKEFETGLGYILDLFLDSDIKTLNFIHMQHMIMNWVDSCRLSNKDPKAERQLNHGQVEGSMLRSLGQRADKLSGIETLIWPHLVSGELLRLIGRHLTDLQNLVLSCDCQVAGRDEDEDTFTLMSASGSWEDDLVKALSCLYGRTPGDFSASTSRTSHTGCPNLKKLVLPHLEDENGVAASSIATALCILTKLEFVTGVPLMTALMKFKAKNKTLTSLNLRNLSDHDLYMRRPMPEESYLKMLLPKLDTIDILASHSITRQIALKFNSVTTLKVEWTDFENYTKNFANLTTLDLTLTYGGVWQLLRNIGFHCKMIKSLTLRQPTLTVSDDHEQGVASPKLPSLEHLKVVRSSFIEFTAFKNLIIGCPSLKQLYLTLTNDRNYVVDELCDALIRSVSPYLLNLESFTVEALYRYNLCMHLNCTLTLDSVRVLMESCPNITYIGHLDSWDVVDKEIEELQQEVRSRNLNLQIQ